MARDAAYCKRRICGRAARESDSDGDGVQSMSACVESRCRQSAEIETHHVTQSLASREIHNIVISLVLYA